MNPDEYTALLPTLPVLAEELTALGIPVTSHIREDATGYRDIRRYRGQPLREGVLYLLTPKFAHAFPRDRAAYVAIGEIPGKADHLLCPPGSEAQVEELLRDLFFQFQDASNQISALMYQGGTLDDLCDLGDRLMENALLIHDNWFLILARSRSSDAIIPHSGSPWEVIPQKYLEEFRIDAEYQRTYQHRQAALWQDNITGARFDSIYVNLYDEDVYLGRLLVMEKGRKFRKKDYLLAQLLARQAMVLLRGQRGGNTTRNRGTDDILRDILHGKFTDPSEFSALLQVLRWEKTDRFLCLRIQRQEPIKTDAMAAILHRDLFLAFPGSYVMATGEQQCVVVNLTKTPTSIPRVRHALSPLCRDYYQFSGISSPVSGIQELSIAYSQAGEALEQAFHRRNYRWILCFSDCALDYMLTRLNTPMQVRHLVAPQLLELQRHDREKDSQLFLTLKTYLQNERDIPKTAASLIIHRTTLTYRLKKLQSLLEMDLEDPEVRLYLLLSLKMLEQEKTVKLAEVAREA